MGDINQVKAEALSAASTHIETYMRAVKDLHECLRLTTPPSGGERSEADERRFNALNKAADTAETRLESELLSSVAKSHGVDRPGKARQAEGPHATGQDTTVKETVRQWMLEIAEEAIAPISAEWRVRTTRANEARPSQKGLSQ
jgi:hypothetical protein